MRLRMTLFQALACCLLMTACQQTDSQADYPSPPTNSYRTVSLQLTTGDTSHSIRGALVTPVFFAGMLKPPLTGRYFVPEEHQPDDRQGVVILSHALWKKRFGSDPTLIGTSAVINGREHKIIGVMPEEFNAPEGAEVWLPEVSSN